ncbi:hypothetical protein SLE2022_319250 [Rubroshorea leprosula]
MKSDQEIKDMFTHFTKITNELKLFDRVLPEEDKVRKILRSLPKSWSSIKTTIEEAHDLSAMTVEMLQGKLLTHEMAMKNYESDDDSQKKKSVAFKSSSKDESDSDEEDDEKFIVLARKFKSFLRKDKLKNQGQQKKDYKSSKGNGESSKKDEIICYKCKKAGHIKSECPNNDKKSLKAKKKKKAMVATWSCSEDSSSSEEVSDMEAHICLMANDDADEVNSISSSNFDHASDDEMPYEDLQDAFSELSEHTKQISAKNASLKREILSLRKENSDLKESLNEEKIISQNLETNLEESTIAFRNCKQKLIEEYDTLVDELKGKISSLECSLNNFVKGKGKLDNNLSSQRFPHNRAGPSFELSKSYSSKSTVFMNCNTLHSYDIVEASSSRDNHVHDGIICHYCLKRGHYIHQCYTRKNFFKMNLKWVPKKISACSTNLNGPKKVWVPKSSA